LYRRVEVVLAQYPGLVEGFVGFLEPDQAVEAGVVSLLMKLTRKTAYLTIVPQARVEYEMVGSDLISNKASEVFFFFIKNDPKI